MQCVRCGMTMREDQEYCSFCGHKQPVKKDEIREDVASTKVGLGGWLSLFQIRIYLQIVLALQVIWFSPHTWAVWLAGALLTPYVYVLWKFYSRSRRFRIVYTVTVVLYGVALLVLAALGYAPWWLAIGHAVLEGGMVWALFRSKRVGDTFQKC